jgi:hypothetical protein
MKASHIFLIHSSVVGHLGCFQSLAIVNSAVINMGVQEALLYTGAHSFGYSSQVELLDHMVALFLVFWVTSIKLSTVVALIYIPINHVEVFLPPSQQPHRIFCCCLCY